MLTRLLARACLLAMALVATAAQGQQDPAATVVITATRGQRSLADVPASVTVVGREELQATPGESIDDLIRTVPSVELPFMASYQLHPTANLISMRGLRSGFTSHALVMLDGVPINDSFSGFVQWNRVPKENVDRIEIVRGGGASLWGTYAMGGVINIITRVPKANQLSAEAGYGSLGTYHADLYGALIASEALTVSADVNRFNTDGYNPIPPAERTPLFVPTAFVADTAQFAANARLARDLTGYARLNLHQNHQTLFTPLSRNEQSVASFDLGTTKTFAGGSTLGGTLFHNNGHFQTDNTDDPNNPGGGSFTAEYVQNRHRTAVTDTGGSLIWASRAGGHGPAVSLGADAREISGSDIADIFDTTETQVRTDVGRGKQRFLGAFGQLGVFPLQKLEVLASARVQQWRNYEGFDGTLGGPGPVPDKTSTSLDPRVSLRYELTSAFALRAAAYKAFNAPNLDNLYRAFSTPSGIFLPNSQLDPERLVGGEVGFDVNARRLRGQVSFYRSDINKLITSRNLDPAEVPAGFFFGTRLINAGKARTQGMEAEFESPLTSALTARFGYAYTDAKLVENELDPASVGQQLQYVPRHKLTAGLSFARAGWQAALRARWVSETWGDNDHTLPIDPHTVVDASAGVDLMRSVNVFAQVANLFDRTYIADNSGFAPRMLGAPRTVFVGVRVRFI